ncbi:hypothetical protein Tco_1112138 [Tanacetum coccineum]|uniref:Uncharacterized protein n=1 Tax=Tanacetum coccineum TaxID=301880 RepID=A0ABQ5INM7_9ASTR
MERIKIVQSCDKIRDITVIDIQEVCKVYDEEKGTKDGENKLGDTDIEIDDGDKEDTVVGNSLDGNQAMKMRVVMSEEKRGVSLSSLVGSRGDRSRKKRKSYDEEVFGGDGVEKAFNKVEVVGLGENKKGISDDYKEYHDESRENNGIFRFGNSKDDEAQSKRCNLNMEQVKEIREMIGVSWKLAKDVMSRKTVDRVDSEEEVAAKEPLI